MATDASEKLRIARLEARVAALEAALARRSEVLRKLQRQLCARDLALLARLEAGLPSLPAAALDPDLWRETTELSSAEVDETLEDLWRSLTPERPPANDDAEPPAAD